MYIVKLKRKKGSSPAEVGLVAAGVLLVGMFSFSLFGDNIANVFQDKGKLAMFESDSNRAAIPKVNPSLLTNTDLTINNQSLKTPIEAYIRNSSGGGKLIETNGSAGNMKDLALIAKKYLAQIQETTKATNTNTSGLDNAIKIFNETVDDYLAKDETIVYGQDDPMLRIINELDLAIDLSREGDVAKNLAIESDKVLEQLPVGSDRFLLEAYAKDILKMGKRIDYHVDSRQYESFKKYIEDYLHPAPEDYVPPPEPAPGESDPATVETEPVIPVGEVEFAQMYNIALTLAESILDSERSIDTSKNDFFESIRDGLDENDYFDGRMELDEDEEDNYNVPQVYKADGTLENSAFFDDGYFELKNKQRLYIGRNGTEPLLWIFTEGSNNDTHVIGENVFGFKVDSYSINPLGTTGDGHENTCTDSGWSCTKDYHTELIENGSASSGLLLSKYDKLVALKDNLQTIYDDATVTDEKKLELANKVDVYINGPFSEVFESSFNNDALCRSLKGTVKDNKCNIDERVYKEIEKADTNDDKLVDFVIDQSDDDMDSDDDIDIDNDRDDKSLVDKYLELVLDDDDTSDDSDDKTSDSNDSNDGTL